MLEFDSTYARLYCKSKDWTLSSLYEVVGRIRRGPEIFLLLWKLYLKEKAPSTLCYIPWRRPANHGINQCCCSLIRTTLSGTSRLHTNIPRWLPPWFFCLTSMEPEPTPTPPIRSRPWHEEIAVVRCDEDNGSSSMFLYTTACSLSSNIHYNPKSQRVMTYKYTNQTLYFSYSSLLSSSSEPSERVSLEVCFSFQTFS